MNDELKTIIIMIKMMTMIILIKMMIKKMMMMMMLFRSLGSLDPISTWYYDQRITTYAILKSGLCTVPETSGLWNMPGLVFFLIEYLNSSFSNFLLSIPYTTSEYRPLIIQSLNSARSNSSQYLKIIPLS